MAFKNRRKQIASAVVDEIANNLHQPFVGAPDFLLAAFKDACNRAGFAPSEKDARQIFCYVHKEIAVRQRRAADALSSLSRPMPSEDGKA